MSLESRVPVRAPGRCSGHTSQLWQTCRCYCWSRSADRHCSYRSHSASSSHWVCGAGSSGWINTLCLLQLLPYTQHQHLWPSMWHPCFLTSWNLLCQSSRLWRFLRCKTHRCISLWKSLRFQTFLLLNVPKTSESLGTVCQMKPARSVDVAGLGPPLPAESTPPMCVTTPVVEGPSVVVEHVQPDPVTAYAAQASAVALAALAPVVEDIVPTPAVTYAAEQAPVGDFSAPAPAVSYAALALVDEYIASAADCVASAPAVTCAMPAPISEHTEPAPVDRFRRSSSCPFRSARSFHRAPHWHLGFDKDGNSCEVTKLGYGLPFCGKIRVLSPWEERGRWESGRWIHIRVFVISEPVSQSDAKRRRLWLRTVHDMANRRGPRWYSNTRHMTELGALVVPYVLGRVVYVAEIPILRYVYFSFSLKILQNTNFPRHPNFREFGNCSSPVFTTAPVVDAPPVVVWVHHRHGTAPVIEYVASAPHVVYASVWRHPLPSTPPVQSLIRHLLPWSSMPLSSHLRGACSWSRVRHSGRLWMWHQSSL